MSRILATVPLGFLLLLAAAPVAADEVIFLNGDRLTGKVVSAAGGKLVIKTDAAGEVTIDLAKVKTFSTDAPVQVKVGDKRPVTTPVTAGPDGQVQIAPGEPPRPRHCRSRRWPPSIRSRPSGMGAWRSMAS